MEVGAFGLFLSRLCGGEGIDELYVEKGTFLSRLCGGEVGYNPIS